MEADALGELNYDILEDEAEVLSEWDYNDLNLEVSPPRRSSHLRQQWTPPLSHEQLERLEERLLNEM